MAVTLSSDGPRVLLRSTQQSAAKFLRQLPVGPYTSLALLKSGHVVQWQAHLQRLEQGLQASLTRSKNQAKGPLPGKCDSIPSTVLPLLNESYKSIAEPGEVDLSIVVLLEEDERCAQIYLAAVSLALCCF